MASYAEDYELWLLMYQNKAKFLNVDSFLFKYRHFRESLSQKNFKKNRRDAKRLGLEFVKNNKEQCLKSFNIILNQSLSAREDELIVMLGMRLSIVFKTLNPLVRSIKKIQKKNLPTSIAKAIYVTFID